MRSWAKLLLFVALFGVGAAFRGNWVTLSSIGFISGFLLGFVDWQTDRQLRSFDANTRWAILKFWMVGCILVALLAAGSAYWFAKQDSLISGAAVFLGVGIAALTCEMLARRRSLA